MYNVIELVCDWWAEAVRSHGQVLLPRGTWRRARVRPRLVEAGEQTVEVADLCFEDGSVARGIPFAAFAFAD